MGGISICTELPVVVQQGHGSKETGVAVVLSDQTCQTICVDEVPVAV
jgi:hypothetical protein